MKKLKYLSLILVLSCVVILSGCANIEYQRLVDDFGQILDKITIEIDETKLPSDVNVNTLVGKIKGDLSKYYVNPMRQRLAVFKIEHPVEYHQLVDCVSINDPTESVENGIHKITVETIFASSEVMAFMYGYDSTETDTSDGLSESKSFFIKKYTQTSDNVFGDITQIEFDGENLYNKYAEYVGEEYDPSDITLTQIYGSTDSRMHTNATQTIDYNGFTCHLWEFSGDDSSGKLVFYYLTANPTGWYILALALTFVIVLLVVVIYVYKSRKNKYKSKINVANTNDFDKGE